MSDSQDIPKQNSEKLEDQQSSGKVLQKGENLQKFSSANLDHSDNQSNIISQNLQEIKHKSEQQNQHHRMNMEIYIYPTEFQKQQEIRNFIKNFPFNYNHTIENFLSILYAHLQAQNEIQNFNVVIQTNNGGPDINTQQREFEKENLKQYFIKKVNVYKDPQIKEFLKSKFQDIFPKKQVTENDFIIFTINLVLIEIK